MACHTTVQQNLTPDSGSIALIGHPNVGKSAIFQQMTGQRVMVSNYPGTTVEIVRGAIQNLPGINLVDTPGVVAFPPRSEDEAVTGRVLLDEKIQAIIQVGDAKNLRRTLALTVQLAEMGLPLTLALNMMDEASARGMMLDTARLSQVLGIPVVPTVAVKGDGLVELQSALLAALPTGFFLEYPQEIEDSLAKIMPVLPASPISLRALGLLWLSGDVVSEDWLHRHLNAGQFQELIEYRQELIQGLAEKGRPVPDAWIQQTRQAFIERLARDVLTKTATDQTGLAIQISRLTTHPVWGVGVLLLVLYALYWFVGVFGAGILVDFLEGRIFGEILNPRIITFFEQLLPWSWLSDLLVGPYGLWTMGMTYALALILPIVSIFFLAFGIMEDSGYLPRLAALTNRMFQALGLNGKAVLPMVLGLGCVTMATVTTRVLESKRERLLVTLLLALAIPCSAQLGVVMGMLAAISLSATLLWAGVVFLVMLAIGWLAARLMPGDRTPLMVELPPLRLPLFSNILIKTLARLEWYVKEVVPLFLLGALIMFFLDRTNALGFLTRLGEPLVTGWLGLPPEASAAFLMGFLRRDFGATGLFVMSSRGMLNSAQIVVAMVTITLFVPCIASVMMIVKERGWKSAVGILLVIFPLAFLIGGLLQRGLALIQWGV